VQPAARAHRNRVVPAGAGGARGGRRWIFHRTIDASGTAPGIETLPHREIAAHQARLIFNPVQAVPPELTFDRVAFAVDASGGGHVQHAEAGAALRRYTPRARYILPVRRRLLVRSGYDVLSHHRRFDYFHPMAEALHFSANFMRYAYDLFVVDSSGAAARGDGRRSEDWFGYGEPVHAPGDGIVVEAVATYSDDFGGQRLSMEGMPVTGTYIRSLAAGYGSSGAGR